MIASRWIGIASIAVAALAASGIATAQAPYVDAANRFSFTPPEGWQAIGGDEIEQMNQALQQEMGLTNSPYVAGYRGPGPIESAPYLLVQVEPRDLRRASWNAIERGLKRDWDRDFEEAKRKLGEAAPDIDLGDWGDPPKIDRVRGRMLNEMVMNYPEIGRVAMFSASHYGKAGLVHLYSYAPAAESDRWRPVIQRSFDSFRYDPGAEFVPSDSPLARIFGGASRGAVLGAMVGLVVGVVVWASRKFSGKAPPSTPRGGGRSDLFGTESAR